MEGRIVTKDTKNRKRKKKLFRMPPPAGYVGNGCPETGQQFRNSIEPSPSNSVIPGGLSGASADPQATMAWCRANCKFASV